MLLSPLFSPGESHLDTCVWSWASHTEVVLGVNLRRSLPEDTEGADSSHGLKKREQPQKTALLGIHTLKSTWKTTNYIDATSNSAKNLSSTLLEPGRAFWGTELSGLALFLSNQYLLVTAATGLSCSACFVLLHLLGKLFLVEQCGRWMELCPGLEKTQRSCWRWSSVEDFCPMPRSYTWKGWGKSCLEELPSRSLLLDILGSQTITWWM